MRIGCNDKFPLSPDRPGSLDPWLKRVTNIRALLPPWNFGQLLIPRSGKLKIRRITVVSVLARCDKSSNEHSEAAAFFGGGRETDRFSSCVPSHFSDVIRDLCTSVL